MQTIVTVLAITLPWLNPFSPGPSPATVPLLFSWACLVVLSAIQAHAPEPSGGGRLCEITALAWLAAALLSATIGLLQYFGATAAFGAWVNNTALGEAYANLRQRNQFASLMNIGLVVALWWVASDRPRGMHRASIDAPSALGVPDVPLAGVLAVAAVLAAGNAASSSRTGVLQLVLVLALFLWWGLPRRSAAAALLLTTGLSYWMAAFALPRLAGLDPSSVGILARLRDGVPECASRLTLWDNVLQLIAQKPWLGWGWGELDYAHFVTLYPGPRFCDILDNAHNLPLHLAVELGIPFAVLVCGLGLWLVVRARPWRESDPDRRMAWAVLAVILLHSLLEYPLWYGPFQIAFGLCVWVLWSSRPAAPDRRGIVAARLPSRPGTTAGRFSRPITLAISVLLVLGIAYAAWDYHRISQIYLPVKMRSPVYQENTLDKIRASWLFRNQVGFAELTTSELTPDNADHLNAMAHDLLHFSPEARIAEKLIESAVLLGRDDEALFYLARYRAAFPVEHARWAKANNARAALGQ